MRKTFAAASAAALLSAAPAIATVTAFDGNLAGFNAAAGNPPITINFDSGSGNIAGMTIAGVTFTSPDGNTLEIVPAASTVSALGNSSNTLIATSGANVLSPGGANMPGGPALGQQDSLQLVFSSPLSSFGLDVIFESLDCCSFFGYTVYGAGNVVLASNSPVSISGNGASGSLFLGFVSDNPSTNITRIVFTEFDNDSNNPDANVGYDTLRFVPPNLVPSIPEPGTWATMLLGFGMAGIMLRRRKGFARLKAA